MSMAGSSTIRTSSPATPNTFEFLYHGSCPKCHHFHIAKRLRLPRSLDVHIKIACDHCKNAMFGGGRTSTRISLASEITTDLENDRALLPVSASVSVSGSRQASFNVSTPGDTSLAQQSSSSPAIAVLQAHTNEVATNGSLGGKPIPPPKPQAKRSHRQLARAKDLLLRLKLSLSASNKVLNSKSFTEDKGVQTETVTIFQPMPPARTGSGLRAPPINTQQTIPEAPEEESPLAHISHDVFKDFDAQAEDATATKLRAHRSERTAQKNALLRAKYREHCHTCTCNSQNAGGMSNQTSAAADASPIARSTERSSRAANLAQTAEFVNNNLSLFAQGPHFSPPRRSSSPHSSEKSLSSATTAIERRSSIQSLHPRRSNSFPTSGGDILAYFERYRPGLANVLRTYDQQGQGQRPESPPATGGNGFLQADGTNWVRPRSPLRRSQINDHISEENIEVDLLSGVGAGIGTHVSDESTSEAISPRRINSDGLTNGVNVSEQEDG